MGFMYTNRKSNVQQANKLEW